MVIHLHGDTPNSNYWKLLENIAIKNAGDIIDITEFMNKGGNFRTASSLWRFRFLYEFGGWYSDCDALALKPWPDRFKWVLCSGNRKLISTGVLKVPAHEEMFLFMINKLKHKWGNVGVFNDAYLRFKGDTNTNFESSEFYPFKWDEWKVLLKDRQIPDNCYSVHLYNTMFCRDGIINDMQQWCDDNPDTMLGRLNRWVNE